MSSPRQNEMPRLALRWVGQDAAKYATRLWHYSGSTPTPPMNVVGAWEDGKFIGVVIFSRGNAPQAARPFGIVTSEMCELTRVALSAHRTPVSRIVAIAVKMLKRANPGIRLIVSFADPEHGHHGGIYQALGWTYIGTTQKSREYIDAGGRRWHDRMVSPTGAKCVYGVYRAVVKPSECRIVHHAPKHKYVLALDAEMAKRVESMARPYPKRVRSSEIGGDHLSTGGAAPTRTLHLSS